MAAKYPVYGEAGPLTVLLAVEMPTRRRTPEITLNPRQYQQAGEWICQANAFPSEALLIGSV